MYGLKPVPFRLTQYSLSGAVSRADARSAFSQGLKPHWMVWSLMYGLKPVPFRLTRYPSRAKPIDDAGLNVRVEARTLQTDPCPSIGEHSQGRSARQRELDCSPFCFDWADFFSAGGGVGDGWGAETLDNEGDAAVDKLMAEFPPKGK
jgi:hypothetical protein